MHFRSQHPLPPADSPLLVGQGLEELTDEQLQEILQMFVEQVVTDGDNNVDITLAIPTDDDSPETSSSGADSIGFDFVAIVSEKTLIAGLP